MIGMVTSCTGKQTLLPALLPALGLFMLATAGCLLAGTILDFIARMPGVLVRGTTVLYRQKNVTFMLDGHIEQPLADILYSDLGYRTLQQRPNVKVSSLFTP